MKITLKNIGVIQEAEFELGDLTIICGENNMGKTYAAYALYGFLIGWKLGLKAPVNSGTLDDIIQKGTGRIDLEKLARDREDILERGCVAYTKSLQRVFASREKFSEATFRVHLDGYETPSRKLKRRVRIGEKSHIAIANLEDNLSLFTVSLVHEGKLEIPREFIETILSDVFVEILFSSVFPDTYIASAERTGAAIFRKELDFARNRLLEEMKHDKKIDPMELLLKVYQDYALPVRDNVEFTRNIESLSKQESFLARDHPDILKDFSDIIGGEYDVRNEDVFFKPKKGRRKLPMNESSSAVRSLLDIGMYLNHAAEPGDLLIIDEPELNLHPVNQRRVARLFARLVNLGIKVFITTHSDYIIKELNTLIMLKQDKEYLKKIADEYSYKSSEFLSAEKVKLYIAKKASIRRLGKSRKSNCQTLVPADINQKEGIEVPSFDETINEMNKIQDMIVWRNGE